MSIVAEPTKRLWPTCRAPIAWFRENSVEIVVMVALLAVLPASIVVVMLTE